MIYKLFPYLFLPKQVLHILLYLLLQILSLSTELRELTIQGQHFLAELIFCHSVILNHDTYIATSIETPIIVLNAILTSYLRYFAQADDITIGTIRPSFEQPIHLFLLSFCLVFVNQCPESIAISLIEASDDTEVFDLLIRELAVRSIHLRKDVTSIDE